MRYVITGGCGFIGSCFINLLLSEKTPPNIVNIDKMTYAASESHNEVFQQYENYAFHKEDICDYLAMSRIIQEDDVVVNFAAESHVDNSIADDEPFLRTNILGVANLLRVCRERKAKLFIQCSTDEVYGSLDPKQRRSVETDLLRPSSPYSASKAAAEMLCFSAMRTFNQPIIITRSSNNYGIHQHPEKLIPHFIKRIAQGKKVPLYGNGQNIRDWISVWDNCWAIQFLIEHGHPGEIYNIGGGNEKSNLELTRHILRYMKAEESLIQYVQDRQGHDFRYALDSSKMVRLGWKPKLDFDSSMAATIEFFWKEATKEMECGISS